MDKIDLDAIMDSKNVDENGFSYDTVKWLMKETARQALLLASKKASLERYFPDEQTDKDGLYPDEDNYEASYISPYRENSGCTIWVSKQSILDVEKFIK